jgi:hypothetical protein
MREEMAATRNVVNLDALLPREDLSAPVSPATGDIQGLKITDLAPGLTYSWLRKPDFQRETASWSPQQVADLIETFVTGSIIPAIILWQSGQRVFVIDGAHRLSALIAWVRDDYGAGELSARAARNMIPDQQRAMHEATRKLVHEKVRSYQAHLAAAEFPKAAEADVLDRATKINFRTIEVQWIKNASVQQATAAFFRINQGGTKIDPTETRILRAKSSALAISSRAITRAGAGHNYWERFEPETREAIQDLGAEIHRLLYEPALKVPVKTTDVPMAGFGYGSHVLPFAFDLVTHANSLGIPDSSRRPRESKEISDDPDGSETVRYLKKTRETVRFLCSNDPSSVGLHPALYFYTAGGSFQPTALLNLAEWLELLEEKRQLNAFLDVRGSLENLILTHPVIVKPATHKLGSGGRTRARMISLFNRVFDLLKEGKSSDDVWKGVIGQSDFSFLAGDDHEEKREALEGKPGGRFGRAAKTAGFFAQFLPTTQRCTLCNGLLHTNAMVAHHKHEKSQGGSSASSNAEMVHPICNSNDRIRQVN